jgi:hypothetical protein
MGGFFNHSVPGLRSGNTEYAGSLSIISKSLKKSLAAKG